MSQYRLIGISKGDESSEDEDYEWEPQPDHYYYGEIFSNITLEDLVIIMSNGLYNYYQDAKLHVRKIDMEYMMGILHNWLEQDFLHENLFDHLLPIEQGLEQDMINENFYQKISEILREKLPNLL